MQWKFRAWLSLHKRPNSPQIPANLNSYKLTRAQFGGWDVWMMDSSVMQERIGQLCGQFKLPTVAAETVARFTAAGHGDVLASFLEG